MLREVLTIERLRAMGAAEAAAVLLVRQDQGDDRVDDAIFEAWLHDDPANPDAWASASAAWGYFDHFGGQDELTTMIEQARIRAPVPWLSRRAIVACAILVSVLATGLIGQHYLFPGSSADPQIADADPPETRMFSTAKGEQRTVVLADGTRIVLNTDTAIAVSYPLAQRRVDLQRGQALFRVVHNAAKPFVVTVGNRSITDLGTSFEVRRQAREMRVILVNGSVAVVADASGKAAPIVLKPGQQLVAKDTQVAVLAADLASIDDWQRGVITFQNSTLGDAVAEFNRYSANKIVVRNPRVASLRVSGVFHSDDSKRFIGTVEQLYPVHAIPIDATSDEIVSGGRAHR